MKATHRRTLTAIFATPTPANLAWRQIETLFVALGAQTIEGRGSRVRFELVHSGVNTTAVTKPKLLEWIGQNRYGLIYAGIY